MNTDRQKGYFGVKLDGKKLAKIANKIYALQYKNPTGCTVDDLLFIELKPKPEYGARPRYAVVNTEGVGYYQDDFRKIPVCTNIGEWGLWNGEVHISIDVIQDCLTDEVVDIADYVRVFGDRLDNNVWLWQSEMVRQPQFLTELQK